MAAQQMFNPMDYPVTFFVSSLLAFWFSAWIGASWRARRGNLTEEVRGFLALILGAALTLLGLIIAFTFSMAVSRYDQRKNYEEQEANAIGTEYVRADQLSPDGAAKVHALLKSYLDQRILFYKAHSEDELRPINARTAQLQTEMWAEASTSSAALPAQILTFVLGGMNDVLNSQGYTQAAWWNRIPIAAWMLLIAIAIFCNLLIGYDAPGRSAFFLLILPIALSIALFLIADIDTPRHGIIRVRPQNLESLAESLHSQ
jgi:F0F1-type ATP synthase membrane subunit c/vacuolar-type H+-ATPase subunit K